MNVPGHNPETCEKFPMLSRSLSLPALSYHFRERVEAMTACVGHCGEMRVSCVDAACPERESGQQ